MLSFDLCRVPVSPSGLSGLEPVLASSGSGSGLGRCTDDNTGSDSMLSSLMEIVEPIPFLWPDLTMKKRRKKTDESMKRRGVTTSPFYLCVQCMNFRRYYHPFSDLLRLDHWKPHLAISQNSPENKTQTRDTYPGGEIPSSHWGSISMSIAGDFDPNLLLVRPCR